MNFKEITVSYWILCYFTQYFKNCWTRPPPLWSIHFSALWTR